MTMMAIQSVRGSGLALYCTCVTGSERSPAFGLSELRMTIQKNGGEPTERLPTSFTCFCTFLLPEYGTKEKLQRLLTIAIEASEGFGLQ